MDAYVQWLSKPRQPTRGINVVQRWVDRLSHAFGHPNTFTWRKMKNGHEWMVTEWRFTFDSMGKRYFITIAEQGKLVVSVRHEMHRNKASFSPRDWRRAEDFLFNCWGLDFHRFKLEQ
jgi:hypothetical protein